MKRIYFLFVVLLSTMFFSKAQNEQPAWILGENVSYSQQIIQDFNSRTALPLDVQQKMSLLAASSTFNDSRTYNALAFLYAYMPQSDLIDYPFSFFKQQVDIAFEARETFSWGKSIPANIFRHFVLVYRVNNEDLDTARSYIFHQLKERLKGLSMYEAALEVNHWCHEYVDYQPADVRTSSPLATLKTSHGRCGEESTLTVTALRAVGIPARQCYTPRWAHCDDNHAWVEVWTNGKWHFLGACEPDPELNMGWFAVPSSRTMMVHTNVFGKYNGPEEVNKQTRFYSCINVLSNYAETVKLNVHVTDEQGKPIQDASVRFKLYNYAEYYTLATRKTDAQGNASIITGKGDLLVWVSKNDLYSYAKIDGRSQNSITLQLTEHLNQDNVVETLDMNPPVGGTQLIQTTPERQKINDQRKQYEDSLREAYRASWPTFDYLSANNIHNDNFTDQALYDIIHRSEGNYEEIIKFLKNHNTKDEHLLIQEYMEALSDKDLRDVTAQVLEEQLEVYRPEAYAKDVFIKGILPARISNELLRADRRAIRNFFKDIFPTRPSIDNLLQYVHENIVVDNDCNYYNCPISPMGVLTGTTTDAHSLNIFFVAICRALGIPSYMDNSNGDIYAWQQDATNTKIGRWEKIYVTPKNAVSATEATEKKDNTSTIILHNPNHYTYYIHYTLQRFENGEYVSYDFENDPRVEVEPIQLSVPAGKYCLSTGNRYSNGDVLSQLEFFTIEENAVVEKSIFLRPLITLEHNYGRIDVDQTIINGKSLQSRMSECGKNRLILCLVTPGTEPVNHLVKELESKRHDYELWNGPIVFLSKNNLWKESKKLPRNIEVTENHYDTTLSSILKGLVEKHDGHNPVCIVVDQNGTIRFFSEGYHIGLGEFLLKEAQ